MANVKRKQAYQQAHEAMTAMALLTFGAVQQLQAGQRLHPSRQAAYAKRAKRLLREVTLQVDEVLDSVRAVADFVPYEQRAPKKKSKR
jgi:hypothetical protein